MKRRHSVVPEQYQKQCLIFIDVFEAYHNGEAWPESVDNLSRTYLFVSPWKT
jgi:hypothetical protein